MKARCCCMILSLSAGCFVVGLSSVANSRPPNVILMMADDLGWGDTGYNGHKIIRTPALDAMSREGLKFNRFYAASSVCSPTRGACLTGRHPFRYGVYTANVGHLKDQEACLAELLRDRGYATGHFGKWHLGTLSPDYSPRGAKRSRRVNYSPPGANGFDEWFSTEHAVATWDPYDKANKHGSFPWDARNFYWHNGKPVTEGLKGDDSRIVMDRAIPFIEDAANNDKPFFAVIWFHAPHLPVVGGPDYLAMYKDHTENEQHYYACITALDEQVGRLRARLDDLHVAADTMLWFCSDNGPEGNPGPRGRSQGSAGPFRGRKRSLYEGGIRVPGLLVWPDKIHEPRQVDAPCVTSDYFPTILDVLGDELPLTRPYDGVSLLPIIDGQATARPQPICFRFGRQSALSDNRFKLVHNESKTRQRSDNGDAPFAEWELYDLVNDHAETTNIVNDQPDVFERLKNRLAEWTASCKLSDAGNDY
ncbi:MAG: sulfatase family protein [Aeoliella sp.]